MKYLVCLFTFVLLFVLTQYCVADFHTPEKPTFSFNGGGIKNLDNYTASGAVPLKAIDGYVGVRYIKDGTPDDETTRTHLRARVEGGHQWGRLGIRAYARYGRESAMLQKGLYHGGANVEVDIIRHGDLRLIVGGGTWAERQQLLDAYLETADAKDGIDFGPRAHLTLKDKHWTVNSAVLLHADRTYQVRSFFDVEIPIFKVAFFEQLYVAVTGHVDYYSETRHFEADGLQWNWQHAVRLKF